MPRVWFTVILLLIMPFCLWSQSKREFRAAWIATIANIDWPSKQGLPAVQQQEQFIRRLDQLKKLGCNAVIVQVRPACDAIYASSIEPWSHYLTGRQGQPPFPYYDPLIFMIAEAHKRNMEFHAWFNPFRALIDSRNNPNPPDHVTHKHPDWVINYGGKSYLDPGIPAAREYVIRVITDVVKRYDIDAVHLDDYFYPYRIAGSPFGDNKSYALYGGGMERDDWRRNNVSIFISLLNTNIKQIKSYVKLGISPFGVWRNASKDAEGSATRGGQTDYDDLFADVVLWMHKGWVDYLLPQLYWDHGSRAAPFGILLSWWNAHSYGRQVYYGLGVYNMVGAKGGPWATPRELLWQMRDIEHLDAATGYSFYSSVSFDKVGAGLTDSIAAYNRLPAIPPAMRWLDSIPPQPPVLKAIPSSQGSLLQWTLNNPSHETIRYIVYRFINDERVNLDRPDKILRVLSSGSFLDEDANKFRKCTYVVTALDRLWNESAPSNPASTTASQ